MCLCVSLVCGRFVSELRALVFVLFGPPGAFGFCYRQSVDLFVFFPLWATLELHCSTWAFMLAPLEYIVFLLNLKDIGSPF